MKKILQIILIFAACSIAYAAVSLTITVPDQYTAQVLVAMNTLAGTDMTLEARGTSPNPEDEFNGYWDFIISPKDPNETNRQFAERFTKELLRASVRVVKSYEERERYNNEVGAVNPPDVNVPDEVIQ